MTLTPLHPTPAAPSSPPAASRLDRAAAESLGERIQQQAALIAEATCEFLLMVADFDECEAIGWFAGLKSTAHWLAWACSMSPGTAREHVRVARALPAMPRTVAAFRAGGLSYSKVREMTRVADRVDEEVLVDLARAMTASQLARALSSFRAVEGARLGQDSIRQASWGVREDGMVEIRAVLPPEAGAELVTALDLALEQDGHDAPVDGTTEEASSASAAESSAEAARATAAATATTTATLEQRRADALVELARGYLGSAPADRSGQDHHLVVVQVSAEALIRDVPAGTPATPRGIGVGAHVVGPDIPLEPATAERLACTGKVAVTITDRTGEVLHLGRARRLASPAQRRALRLRDRTCSFPGCHQARHLDAHHVTPWSQGGGTDIDGLALLCRRHHVIVHEGGHRLVPRPAGPSARFQPRFTVVDRRGELVTVRWPGMLEEIRSTPHGTPVRITGSGAGHGDPERIGATTGGFGFSLADTVDALLAAAFTPAA